MKSDARAYDLLAPTTLEDVLSAMAQEVLTPIAGGTELMVAFGAGRLSQRKLVSLHHCQEMLFIDSSDPETLRIGAASTFATVRHNQTIAREFPLLVQTAGWTGCVANQNRATIGGNIANASPAADTPPALLAYNAELELISARGTRTLPYAEFHLGYKKTALAPDELIYAVRLPRRFHAHQHYVRKVGTRNAQAVSKIALAAVALVGGEFLSEIALGAASLQDRPARLYATEASLRGQNLGDPETFRSASTSLASEVRAIDDIRSTARYRTQVARNLLAEFLEQCAADAKPTAR